MGQTPLGSGELGPPLPRVSRQAPHPSGAHQQVPGIPRTQEEARWQQGQGRSRPNKELPPPRPPPLRLLRGRLQGTSPRNTGQAPTQQGHSRHLQWALTCPFPAGFEDMVPGLSAAHSHDRCPEGRESQCDTIPGPGGSADGAPCKLAPLECPQELSSRATAHALPHDTAAPADGWSTALHHAHLGKPFTLGPGWAQGSES